MDKFWWKQSLEQMVITHLAVQIALTQMEERVSAEVVEEVKRAVVMAAPTPVMVIMARAMAVLEGKGAELI